jgi:hypothetical protein
MVPSQTILEDGMLVYRANTVTATGELRADCIPVGDVLKAEQLATDRDFTGKVSAVFGSNVVDDHTAVDVVAFSVI